MKSTDSDEISASSSLESSTDEEYISAEESLENIDVFAEDNVPVPDITTCTAQAATQLEQQAPSRKRSKRRKHRSSELEYQAPFASVDLVQYDPVEDIKESLDATDLSNCTMKPVATLVELCLRVCHLDHLPPGLHPKKVQFGLQRKLRNVQLSWLHATLHYFETYFKKADDDGSGEDWLYSQPVYHGESQYLLTHIQIHQRKARSVWELKDFMCHKYDSDYYMTKGINILAFSNIEPSRDIHARANLLLSGLFLHLRHYNNNNQCVNI